MSDRQKGIIAALNKQIPWCSIRYCARHIFANFCKLYSADTFRPMFWRAARAANKVDFEHAMNTIKQIDPDAYKWLMDNDPQTWSCHAFNFFFKTDHVINNMTESWNAVLSEYRRKPIIELMEFIRLKMMKRLVRRKEKAEQWDTDLPPRVHRKLAKTAKFARKLLVMKATSEEFEVIDYILDIERHYMVNLKNRSCECGAWEVSDLPCKHAMACITQNNEDPANFVDEALKRSSYIHTYSSMIHPIPDPVNWPTTDMMKLKPPLVLAKVGRPKINRTREANEPPAQKKRYTL